MPTRVLDWNDLCVLAKKGTPPDRQVISLGGLPARIKSHLGTDVGFYVYKLDETAGIDEKWTLRKGEGITLLREYVAAGLVTTEDPDAPAQCFITGCPSPDVDPRGAVHTTDGRTYDACPAHWEAIFAVLGVLDREHAERATASAGETVVVDWTGEVVRCCTAGPCPLPRPATGSTVAPARCCR